MYRQETNRKYKASKKGRYSTYVGCARDRKIEFKLTVEEFESFWQKDCSYCNTPIATIGIDRIDSSIGYEINNVVPCCRMCNEMKLHYTLEEWLDKMYAILKHQGIVK